jgi:hypothetical protein
LADIGSMVERLVKAGCDPAVAASVVAEVFTAGVLSSAYREAPIDEAAERRRIKDRDRKRSTRDQRLPESEWFPLVTQVLNRDGNLCQYCGAGGNLTADHVVPMSRGGTHDITNLVACCLPCNSKKSNRLLCEWLPDPQMSADKSFVSDAARSAILRETSADVRRNPQTENPPLNLSSSTILEVKKEKKVKVRAAPCPQEFQPNEKHFEAAAKLGIPRQAVLDKAEDMRIWAKSKGEIRSDWDATLHGFLRRDASKLQQVKHGRQPGNIIQAADHLVSTIRSFDAGPGDTDEIRSGAGAAPVRLLSKG